MEHFSMCFFCGAESCHFFQDLKRLVIILPDPKHQRVDFHIAHGTLAGCWNQKKWDFNSMVFPDRTFLENFPTKVITPPEN